MFRLTLAAAIAAAEKALDEGRLQFQMPNPPVGCRFRSKADGKTYCCAIGAALPDDVAASGGAVTIGQLLALGAISVDDRSGLAALQCFHDQRVTDRKNGATKEWAEWKFRQELSGLRAATATA